MKETVIVSCENETKQRDQPASVESVTPTTFKRRKRWQIARDRSKDGAQQKLNRITEEHYHMILHEVKLKVVGSPSTVFERDYKRDDSESHLLMHAFMSANIYLTLECEIHYEYITNYAFYQCEHKEAIIKLLMPIIALGRAKLTQVEPDFPTFYNNVLAYQQQRFHHTL